MSGCIVYILEENVGDEDFVVGNGEVFVDGGQYLFDWVRSSNGHEFESFFVKRIMERESEIDVGIVAGQSLDAGDDADSGEGKTARAHGQADLRIGTALDQLAWVVGGGQQVNGGEGIVGIGQRFAHTHEDNGVDGQIIFGEVEDLVDNFIGGQVLFEADDAGSAEEATQGAAGLGGDTKSGVGFVLETDGLDLVVVTSFEENFVGLNPFTFLDFRQGKDLVAQNRNDLLSYRLADVRNLAVTGNTI